jgi:hypothetical protein
MKTNEENQRGSFSFFIFIRDIRSYSCSFVDSLLSLFFLCAFASLRLCVKYFRENLLKKFPHKGWDEEEHELTQIGTNEDE